MFGSHIKIFRLAGFDVKIDLSWVILAALITWSLAAGVFPERVRDLEAAAYWWMGALGALGLFASIVFHELAHSLVARRYGLRIGGITLFIFGGIAEMEEEPAAPRTELLMAIAGPAASVFLGGLFYLLSFALDALELSAPLSAVVRYLGLINLVLAVFNLVPAFPLDGGRALRATLWARWQDFRRATEVAAAIGRAFGTGLIVAGIFFAISGSLVTGLWWSLIGLFLHGASRASEAQVQTHALLSREPISRIATRDPVTVPADATLSELRDDYIAQTFHEAFPVMRGGKPVGIVGIEELKRYGHSEWPGRTVGDIMTPIGEGIAVPPEMDAESLLKKIAAGGKSRLLVVKDGRLEGIVTLKDAMKLLQLKAAIEAIDKKP